MCEVFGYHIISRGSGDFWLVRPIVGVQNVIWATAVKKCWTRVRDEKVRTRLLMSEFSHPKVGIPCPNAAHSRLNKATSSIWPEHHRNWAAAGGNWFHDAHHDDRG